jgi:hypothetical protein
MRRTNDWVGPEPVVKAMREGIVARGGKNARNIQGRRRPTMLEVVYYVLGDGQARCLTPAETGGGSGMCTTKTSCRPGGAMTHLRVGSARVRLLHRQDDVLQLDQSRDPVGRR